MDAHMKKQIKLKEKYKLLKILKVDLYAYILNLEKDTNIQNISVLEWHKKLEDYKNGKVFLEKSNIHQKTNNKVLYQCSNYMAQQSKFPKVHFYTPVA